MVKNLFEIMNWPRQEDVRETAERRDLTSDELLSLLSRSFYVPIQLLELAKGRNEKNKKQVITALYNVLRFQDTLEDANPKVILQGAKPALIDHFCYFMDKYAGVEPRMPKEELNKFVKDELGSYYYNKVLMLDGALSEDERIFIGHFGRGVLQELNPKTTGDIKSAISSCSSKMAIGMKHFLEKGMDTKEKLDEYCKYVAGYVGVGLNKIVELEDHVKLNEDSALTFGRSLQQVNILKNIHEDWKEREIVFIPKEYYKNIENKVLFNTESKEGKPARKSILETLITDSRNALKTSVDYIISVPNELSGYKAFTMIPYLAAVETLNAMQKAKCADAVFSGKTEAIKMNPEAFINLSDFTYQITTADGGKKANEFLTEYKEAQVGKKNFKLSFWTDRYKEWSKKFL